MNENFKDLLEKRIDGTLSTEETQRLDEACETDPELERAVEDALLVDRMVSGIQDVDPPTGLRAQIMGALPDEPSWQRYTAPGAASIRQRRAAGKWRSLLVGSTGFTLGAAIAAFVFFAIVPGVITGPDLESAATGTIAPSESTAITTVEAALTADGIMEISVDRSGSFVTFSVRGDAPAGARLEVSDPGGPSRLAGLQVYRTRTPGQVPGVVTGSGGVEVSVADAFEFEIVLNVSESADAVRVSVLEDAGPVLDRAIDISSTREGN